MQFYEIFYTIQNLIILYLFHCVCRMIIFASNATSLYYELRVDSMIHVVNFTNFLDCKRLTDQLASANAAKCDALLRVSDIEAKEISIKHREDRLEQERELFEERLRGLSEDLRQAHENASLTRRELSAKIAQLDGELSQKTEEIRITEGRTEGLIGDKKVLQSRLDDVIERLKDVRDSKSNLEEGMALLVLFYIFVTCYLESKGPSMLYCYRQE